MGFWIEVIYLLSRSLLQSIYTAPLFLIAPHLCADTQVALVRTGKISLSEASVYDGACKYVCSPRHNVQLPHPAHRCHAYVRQQLHGEAQARLGCLLICIYPKKNKIWQFRYYPIYRIFCGSRMLFHRCLVSYCLIDWHLRLPLQRKYTHCMKALLLNPFYYRCLNLTCSKVWCGDWSRRTPPPRGGAVNVGSYLGGGWRVLFCGTARSETSGRSKSFDSSS